MLPNRGPNDFEGRMPRQTLLLLSDTKDKQDAVLSKYFWRVNGLLDCTKYPY